MTASAVSCSEFADGEVADYNGIALMLSETSQVPRLRHLAVGRRLCPSDRISTVHDCRGPRLSLAVQNHPSAYFEQNILLQWLSFMPQPRVPIIIFYISCSRRRCGEAIVTYTHHNT